MFISNLRSEAHSCLTLAGDLRQSHLALVTTLPPPSLARLWLLLHPRAARSSLEALGTLAISTQL